MCLAHSVGPYSAISARLVKGRHYVNAWAENIAGFPVRDPQSAAISKNVNKKSGSNICLVSTHSACPYKNYSLKLFPEPNHYII